MAADRTDRTDRRKERAPLTDDIGPVDATVKRTILDKGFGFLYLSDGKTEVFFHKTAVSDDRDDNSFEELQPGQKVTIVYANTVKGLRASRVNLL